MSVTRTSLFSRIFRRTPKTIRRSNPAARATLSLTALEAREVPAILSGGSLVITGTQGPDTVTVSHTVPANIWEVSKVQVIQNGRAQLFSRLSIPTGKIYFNGNAGNDTFQNSAYLSVVADGGTGMDMLSGGPENDTLRGGAGNEHDAIYGNGGDDTISGGGGPDELRGGADNDTIPGDGENDTIRGGPGSDTLYGNDGHDTMYGDNNIAGTAGGAGADKMYGGAGNDTMDGEGGNDALYGGTETDYLFGGAGMDGLFGGATDGWDYLNGGADPDRFLIPTYLDSGTSNSLDDAVDYDSGDARIFFANGAAVTTPLAGQTGTFSFNAGAWADADVQRVDVALGNLHRHVGNTRLLKTAAGYEMGFQAVGMQTAGNASIGGWNSGTTITFVNPAANPTAQLERTVYHEFGHNWDEADENPYVDGFRAVSGWQVHDNGGAPFLFAPDGYMLSTDRTWDYLASADGTFAWNYGRTNPHEDMGTTWEAYFVNLYHGGATGLAAASLTANAEKWATLDSLFGDLSQTP